MSESFAQIAGHRCSAIDSRHDRRSRRSTQKFCDAVVEGPARPIAVLASSSRAIISRPPCTPWPTRSIKRSATSARRFSTPIPSTPTRSTRPNRSRIWLPTCARGKVDMLIILGGNPAYDAPADLEFADALKNTSIPLRVHLGLYQNETAELCQWHVNEAHYLEAWGDARAYDGTVSIVQPLIAPLYGGKSALRIRRLAVRASRRHRLRTRAAPTGRSSTPARTSSSSGANRCTMDGSKAPAFTPKQLAREGVRACPPAHS